MMPELTLAMACTIASPSQAVLANDLGHATSLRSGLDV